jgi:hypothetical protein
MVSAYSIGKRYQRSLLGFLRGGWNWNKPALALGCAVTEKKPTIGNFYDLAKALGRWDNEGGAVGPAPAPEAVLSKDEERILQCLGAAVIMQWNELPTGIQRDIFADATSMSDPARQLLLKQQMARFLHDHKDDA